MKPTQNDYLTYLNFISKEIFGTMGITLKENITLKLNLLVRCRIGEITESDYQELVNHLRDCLYKGNPRHVEGMLIFQM